MSSQLFGTDGIRGPAGVYPLDSAGMVQIGKATATYFAQPGDLILIGWDPRESSETLVASAIEGLVAAGANVQRVGVIPTPGLAYATKQLHAKAGVMITASHNPYTDNGVKIFTNDSRKLADDAQAGLNALIATELPDRDGGTSSENLTAVKAYENFLVASSKDVSFRGLNIAIDTANGATSGIGARAFGRLGADVVPLFDKPDGKNINVQCGATDTAALRTAVKEQHLTAGVALDGDGDRVMIIDEQGRELTGDHILYILAVAERQKGVVATIMSNQGLETTLKRHGIDFHRTPVGDRSVLQGLDETGFQLGGEQSGHIIVPEYAPTGDGLLAAIRTLSLVIASGKSLAAWYDEIELLPQAIISVPLTDKKLLDDPEVRAFIKEQIAQLNGTGRLNVRPSGTEPKVRIMVEAPDATKRAETIAAQLSVMTSSKH